MYLAFRTLFLPSSHEKGRLCSKAKARGGWQLLQKAQLRESHRAGHPCWIQTRISRSALLWTCRPAAKPGGVAGWWHQSSVLFTEFTESLGWKRPPRSSSPTHAPTPQLNHGTECHIQTFLNTSRDGDSTTSLGRPFQHFITL